VNPESICGARAPSAGVVAAVNRSDAAAPRLSKLLPASGRGIPFFEKQPHAKYQDGTNLPFVGQILPDAVVRPGAPGMTAPKRPISPYAALPGL
jgi:hypothetical protein